MMQLNWVPAKKFKDLTGFTNQDLYQRRVSGQWLEKVIWCKAEDGLIYYNLKEYESWVQRRQLQN